MVIAAEAADMGQEVMTDRKAPLANKAVSRITTSSLVAIHIETHMVLVMETRHKTITLLEATLVGMTIKITIKPVIQDFRTKITQI